MVLPEIQAEILALYFREKLSLRSLATRFGIDRKSVKAIIERRGVELKPKRAKKGSILDSYKGQIDELLKVDPKIAAATIFQRIRAKGFTGSISLLQHYVASIRPIRYQTREAYLKLDFAPGECAQVDWGEFGNVFKNSAKIHCFAMLLCYSRLLYIEFTRSEKFEQFIRCHENAFRFFGGLVPKECWYDNLASAVSDRMGSLVRFNARFLAYMGHHSIRPHACNVARGNEKGRVEDGIKYIRSSFWAGRKFENFEDLCIQAAQWRDEIANKREHRATRKIPILQFELEEKGALMPMNPQPYDTDEVFSRVAPPDFHITYETNRYSVPWTLVGMTVTIRVCNKYLKVFYNERFITRHWRSYKRHKTKTKREHLAGLMKRKPGATREGWQLHAVKSMGPKMSAYLDLLRAGTRSLRSEVAKILALATVYGENEVYNGCTELLQSGIIGANNLELLLKSCNTSSQLNPKPLSFQKQKLNRTIPSVDLRRYDALLFDSKDGNYLTDDKGDNDE